MDVAVIGVGAIGGLLAAELIAAGNEVTLCGAGRPLEIEPLVGAVLRAAGRHGLAAPRAVRAPQRLVRSDDRGGAEPYFSSREKRRSLRIRPSVWQCGQ